MNVPIRAEMTLPSPKSHPTARSLGVPIKPAPASAAPGSAGCGEGARRSRRRRRWDGRGDRADRALAGAGRRQCGAVEQHDVDRFGRLGDVEDRVGKPVGTGDLGAVEGNLLRQGPAGALDDIAFDAALEPVGG